MRVMRSLRERMPSLSKMCPRWNSTVLTLTYSSAAVCRLDRPAATSRATACSAGVRPGSAGTVWWSRGRASGGELPVADLHIRPGAQRGQALPGRAQPGDGLLRLAGGAQPAGVGDLQLGQRQRHPQALGAVPGGLERRGGRGRVPGRGGQVAAQPGGGYQARRRASW